MVKQWLQIMALVWLPATWAGAGGAGHGASPKAETDTYARWRSAAVRALAVRGDPPSLATAAALTFAGLPSRSRAETAKAATAALDFAVKASELAPNDPAIAWLRLNLCADDPACDIRDAATTLRWVDADNAAAWLPTLAAAERDKDSVEVERVLGDMAEGLRFDLYVNRAAVMMFDSLKRSRTALPAEYARSDLARLSEAMAITGAAMLPSFSPLINACREAADQRREACLVLSKTMQKSDAVLAQLVGFALQKRLTPPDSKDLHGVAERRRRLEWRAATANISDTPLLPWLRNARARTRLAKMRAKPREEDVYIALLKEHGQPLEPPEEHR